MRRRYEPGRLYRLVGRRPNVPVDWTAGADHIIRFEAMQEGLDEALRRVGVAQRHQLPHRNPTTSRADRDYRSLYTDRARAVVDPRLRSGAGAARLFVRRLSPPSLSAVDRVL